jgi:microcystin-dependent protein
MAYEIRFSDLTNKGTLVIEDATLNTETSLSLPGRNTTAYGAAVAESFLHLLENFANNQSPTNPIEGQLWYDNTIGVDQLKVYDGTNWVAAGGLKKSPTAPDVSKSTTGDLWVDTDNQQLYLFTGASWILVGPEFAEGLATGSRPDEIIGTDDKTYNVVVIEVRGESVAIISSDTLTPKTKIDGFNILRPGINLSTINITGDGFARFHGIAEKAEALIVGSTQADIDNPIPASSFMRKDAENTTGYKININSDNGLVIGADSLLKLRMQGSAGYLSNEGGGNLDFGVSVAGNLGTQLRIDGTTGNVGVNQLNPDSDASLHVGGKIKTDTTIEISGQTQSTGVSTGALVVDGGVGIAGDTHIGDTLNVQGITNVGNNIVPTINNISTVGTVDKKFATVHATEFRGTLVGDVIGSVSQRAGSADKLTTPTVFRMSGQVNAPNIQFDGQQGTLTFDTTINDEFIGEQTLVSATEPQDEFIINRVSGTTGIYKVKASSIFEGITGLMPVGVILPYGGKTAPPGWIMCDGQAYLITEYQALFDKIGYSFKSAAQVQASVGNLAGYFAVPDMRGSMPLGVDNMGGTARGRVTEGAGEVGASPEYATETRTLNTRNLPDHVHELSSYDSQGEPELDFYAVLPDENQTSTDLSVLDGFPATQATGTNQGLLIPKTGNIDTDDVVGQPVNIMNPFVAVNYIIYTGVGG